MLRKFLDILDILDIFDDWKFSTSGWRLIEARFEWTHWALWGDESRVFCG